MTSFSVDYNDEQKRKLEEIREGNRLRNEERMAHCRAKRLSRLRRYLGYDSPFKPEPLPDIIKETLTFDNLTMVLSVDLVEAKKHLITIGNMEFFYDQVEHLVELGWKWPD